ncbi:MAG: cellulase family glycosylhydrolase [Lachnospiraceae bacterium]
MKRKSKKRLLAVVSAIIISFVMGLSPYASCYVKAVTVMTADEITKDMGVGWNLGNSLESTGASVWQPTDITAYERNWGNPTVTKELITAVKNKGFKSIRIPVTWYEHISTDGNYTIDSVWMARVKEVVNYAYDQGMYVILNVHHEDWINRSDFTSSYDVMSTELKAVWKQIATEFAGYNQHLIFEGMNEPRCVGNPNISEWSGNETCYEIINQLNKDFVDTVRAVPSDYQRTRLLMIPCYAASSYSSVYSSLTVPKAANSIDSDNDGDDDYIAVSLHAYSPYIFAMGDSTFPYTYDHGTFSETYKKELDTIFNDIRMTFTDKDIPVVIGEFSASDYNNVSARTDWAEYFMTTAKQMGIPCLLWDNNSNLGNAAIDSNFNYSEVHGYINRDDSNLCWYTNSEPVVDKLIYVSNDSNIVWDSKSHYPLYTHEDYSSGTDITISEYNNDGTMEYYINGAVALLQDNTEIAIQYNNSIPKLALMNSEWQGWTEVSPYDLNLSDKIAYFSYESIQNAWNSSTNGPFANIKVIDSNKASLSVSSVKVLIAENLEPSTPEEPVCQHTNTEVKNVVAATCTEEGYTGDTYCKDCGVIRATGTTKAALGHSYGEGVVTTEPTETEDGVRTYTCTVCGATKTEDIPALGTTICAHTNTEIRGARTATCTETGYTGDTYCIDCEEKIVTGNTISASGHSYGEGVVTKEPTETEKGEKTYTCTVCGATKTEDIDATGSSQGENQDGGDQGGSQGTGDQGGSRDGGDQGGSQDGGDQGGSQDAGDQGGNQDAGNQNDGNQFETPQLGTTHTDDKNQAAYTITKAGDVGGCVEYTKPVNKTVSNVTIPATVTLNGITYKVTGIAEGAFKNNTKLTTIKLGSDIKTIGAGAFYGCKKLKNVTIGNNVTTIGDKAFYKCTALTKIIIPSEISVIGKQAFYGCKNLRNIIIKTTKLTSGKVGSNAFKGINKKASVKVPKSKVKAYSIMLKKKGIGAGVKVEK